MAAGTRDGALPVNAVKSKRYLVTSVIEVNGNLNDEVMALVKEQMTFGINRIGGGRLQGVHVRVIDMSLQEKGKDDG